MQSFTFTLSEHDSISARLALHRALHSVEKIIRDYDKLDPVFHATAQHYQQERADIRAALDAITVQYYAQLDNTVGA